MKTYITKNAKELWKLLESKPDLEIVKMFWTNDKLAKIHFSENKTKEEVEKFEKQSYKAMWFCWICGIVLGFCIGFLTFGL